MPEQVRIQFVGHAGLKLRTVTYQTIDIGDQPVLTESRIVILNNNTGDIRHRIILYNDATLNDYTITNDIENMESVTGIDLNALRETYRIIAL